MYRHQHLFFFLFDHDNDDKNKIFTFSIPFSRTSTISTDVTQLSLSLYVKVVESLRLSYAESQQHNFHLLENLLSFSLIFGNYKNVDFDQHHCLTSF